jgi:hypothetical protein
MVNFLEMHKESCAIGEHSGTILLKAYIHLYGDLMNSQDWCNVTAFWNSIPYFRDLLTSQPQYTVQAFNSSHSTDLGALYGHEYN